MMMDPDVERYRCFPRGYGLVRPRNHEIPEDAIPLSTEQRNAVAEECDAIRTHEEMELYLQKKAKELKN